MRVFGVGCVWFAPKDVDGIDHFTAKAFINEVQISLEANENISAVVTQMMEGQEYGNFNYVQRPASDELESEVAVPITYGTRISFDIYLPFRIQERIHDRMDVERVHVDILYGYYFPIMYVSYEWDETKSKSSPSSAVVVIRKFLQEKVSNEKLICDCVGPSPFHADFKIVRDSDIQAPTYKDDTQDLAGYGDINLLVPMSYSIPLIDVFYTNNDTFSFFYEMANIRRSSVRYHGAILQAANSLVRQPTKQNLFRRLWNDSQTATQIDNINRQIVADRLSRIQLNETIREAARSGVISKGPLDRYFDEYIQISQETSWGEFSDLAKFFEDRRQKVIENASVLFSGLSGGLMGALVGSLLTYTLTRPAEQTPVTSAFHAVPSAKLPAVLIPKGPEKILTSKDVERKPQ